MWLHSASVHRVFFLLVTLRDDNCQLSVFEEGILFLEDCKRLCYPFVPQQCLCLTFMSQPFLTLLPVLFPVELPP